MDAKRIELSEPYIVCVSDIHCGSTYGMLPPDFVTHEGNLISQTPFQKWMHACWLDFWEWVDMKTDGLFAVAVIGDSTEGDHHRTIELISPFTGDHKAAAIQLLHPVCNNRPTIIIEGTECHTRNAESDIGRALGAIPYRVPAGGDPGIFAWPQVDARVRGCPGTFRHHISTAIRPYLEATALSTQLGTDRIECIRAGITPPRFLVCAHRHRGGFFSDLDAVSAVCPAWQGITRHARKVVGGARPIVGGLILDFTDADEDNAPAVLPKRYFP